MLSGRCSTRRRWVAVVVAVVVVVPLLVVVPVPAGAVVGRVVVGSGCDGSGDGVPGGVVEEVVSSGADRAARGLAEDAGLVLAPARAAWRWRVPVCAEVVADDGDPVTVDRRVRVVGPAVEELNPAAAAWERSALEEALESLRPRYYRPAPWTSPHVDGVQVVGLETWLAVDPKVWEPFTQTSRDGEVEVSATARPRRVVWEFSDGVVEVCEGPGVQWSPGRWARRRAAGTSLRPPLGAADGVAGPVGVRGGVEVDDRRVGVGGRAG